MDITQINFHGEPDVIESRPALDLPVETTPKKQRARGAAKPLAEIEQESIPRLIGNMAKVPKIDFGRHGKTGGMRQQLVAALAERKLRLPDDALDAVTDVTVVVLDEHLASVRKAFQLRGKILVDRINEAELVEVPLLPWGEPSDESEADHG